MQDLVDIIKEIQSYKDFNFKPSDDAILEASQEIFISNNINSGKKPDFTDSKQKASKQQIWRLKKEGYKGNFDNITSQEASQAITDIGVRKAGNEADARK